MLLRVYTNSFFISANNCRNPDSYIPILGRKMIQTHSETQKWEPTIQKELEQQVLRMTSSLLLQFLSTVCLSACLAGHNRHINRIKYGLREIFISARTHAPTHACEWVSESRLLARLLIKKQPVKSYSTSRRVENSILVWLDRGW